MPRMRAFIFVPEFAEAPADGIEEFRGREVIELSGCDLDRERKSIQRASQRLATA
jgi:hypothetical protein